MVAYRSLVPTANKITRTRLVVIVVTMCKHAHGNDFTRSVGRHNLRTDVVFNSKSLIV